MSGLTPQQEKNPQKKKDKQPEPKVYTFEELKAKLTPKERIFCHEYIVDWNGSRAARKAGYSENTCAETAYDNLRKPHIKQYIEFIKNNLEEEAGVSKLRNLKELAKIAYSNSGEVDETDVEVKYVKIKLYSKQQAIAMINEMMGYKAPVKAELKVESLDYLDDLLHQIKK